MSIKKELNVQTLVNRLPELFEMAEFFKASGIIPDDLSALPDSPFTFHERISKLETAIADALALRGRIETVEAENSVADRLALRGRIEAIEARFNNPPRLQPQFELLEAKSINLETETLALRDRVAALEAQPDSLAELRARVEALENTATAPHKKEHK